MTASDTIYAVSSGIGRSAVAIMRISGSQTSALLESISGNLPPPRRLTLRTLKDPSTGELLDKAMVVWLPGPSSFTGEDCAELHLHGSPAILSAVLELLSKWPGARPAEPGEFTQRAFLNGKMDLVEIEGLADLLEARTAAQRRQAFRQMSGQASSVFESWRHQLLEIRASIEAVVDFAEEPGVAEAAAPQIDRSIRALLGAMHAAMDRSAGSELIRDGFRVVLAGHPNTGKSSLLNALAGREAAIVSDMPGTTRDAIEVTLELDGIPVIVTDTAGLRSKAADSVELEGIRRTRQHMSGADLILWIWSADVPGSELPDSSVQPDLAVQNKSDLASKSGLLRNDRGDILASCRTRDGLQDVLTALKNMLKNRYGTVESALFVSSRQKLTASRSIRCLNDALGVEPDRLELKAENIRRATDEIARLTGKIDVEEWLGAIFSRFCIGK
jgi:tRNA modification GTPase